MRKSRYTEEQFIEAVKTSISIREVLKKIDVRPTGGNYDVAKRKIKCLNLDTKHFRGQGYLRGQTHHWAKKTPLNKVLIENFRGGITTHKLKKRLIREGILEYKCYECGINQWRGKRMSLELEHKNGNRYDNRRENLSLLCPNCHSFTSTYRGKNKRQVIEKYSK